MNIILTLRTFLVSATIQEMLYVDDVNVTAIDFDSIDRHLSSMPAKMNVKFWT